MILISVVTDFLKLTVKIDLTMSTILFLQYVYKTANILVLSISLKWKLGKGVLFSKLKSSEMLFFNCLNTVLSSNTTVFTGIKPMHHIH